MAQYLTIPSECPICGGRTAIKKDNKSKVLICTEPYCRGKLLGRLTHFVSKKAMNIDGLSEMTLELLIENELVHKFYDIYHLSEHAKKLEKLPGLGPKSVKKLLEAIEKSRNVTLDKFICALGIPTIGTTASKTIAKYCNGSYEKLWDLFEECFDWTNLDDIGPIMAAELDSYLDEWWYDTEKLAEEMNFIVQEEQVITESPFTGKSICVTGKLNNFTRDTISEKIISLGAKVASSVSKKTDYLITNEASSSSKYKKAMELNIPVITEEEFLKMIE